MYEPTRQLPTTQEHTGAGSAAVVSPGSLPTEAPAPAYNALAGQLDTAERERRQQWLELRKTGIGGSEIAAIMGLDPYKTALDVQRDKLGLSHDTEPTEQMRLGIWLEDFVASRWHRITGKFALMQSSQRAFGYRYVLGSPDRLYQEENRGWPYSVLEIKTTSPWNFKALKLRGLPANWIMQLQWYMFIFNSKRGSYAVMDRDSGQLMTFEVDADQELGKKMADFAEQWYLRHVVNQEPVEFEMPQAIDLPEVGGECAVMDSNDWRTAVDAYNTAKDLQDQVDALLEEAKAKLVEIMGDLQVAEGAGIRVYYKWQEGRKSLDQKALLADHPDIDVDKYMKRGKPFRSFKPYKTEVR